MKTKKLYFPLESLCLHLPGLDNTSVDKFHDLVANSWVLHVILEGTRVLLRLLQDLLHDRISHYFLHYDGFSQPCVHPGPE